MTEIYRPKTYSQLFDAFKKYLVGESSTLTNFNKGSRNAVLAKALSLILSKTHNDFYQGLKRGLPVSVYKGFDFNKKPGIKSSGSIEFTSNEPSGSDYDIPIGTAVIINGIKFETTIAGQLLTGNSSSGNITAQASEIGESGNIAANSIDTLVGLGSFVSQPNGIDGAKNNVAFSGGSPEETDEERLERFNLYINSLARATVPGILTGTLSVAGIVSASVIENSPYRGYITIFADDGSGTITEALAAEIYRVINGDPTDKVNYPGYRGAGIKFRVLAPTVINQDVSVQIKILNTSNANPNTLKDIAQQAIENYINTLKLGEDIVVTEIIKVVKASDPEIYDCEVLIPTINVTIQSDQIARTGTVNMSHEIVVG